MPRTLRASRGGFVDHVLNRGNGHSDVFHQDDDFAAFVSLTREAHEKVPMRLTGFCLLSNHFHLRLWPHEDGDLSRGMQWLMTSHVRRYHQHDQGSGHNCERQGASHRFVPEIPAASALPLTTCFQSLIYPAKRFRCSPMNTL